MLHVPLAVEVSAVLVGALSGGVHAVGRKADAIGTFSLALATGVGGGIVRDILIGADPPTALRVPLYLPGVALAALLALMFASWIARVYRVLDVLDALLLGLWTVMGAEKALAYQLPLPSVVFLGVVTATGGGVLRDLLSGSAPVSFHKGELYVTAALIAAVVYAALARAPSVTPWVCELVAIATAFSIRVAALRWQITAPGPFDLPGWWRQRRRSG